MIEPFIMITNNRKIADEFEKKYKVYYIEGTLIDVMLHARDFIHKGHRLLTHPLSGSVKPNETPYKTILISKIPGKTINIESLSIIEDSIHTALKLIKDKPAPKWSDKLLEDFSIIDFDLIYNAIN